MKGAAARCFARASITAAVVCALAVAALLSVHRAAGPGPQPSSVQAITATRAPRPGGRLLVRYVVHVPPYYGLTFGPTVSRPFDTRAGRGADLLNRLYDYETGDTFAHVRQEPSYDRCRGSTVFARTVVAELNKSFCYLGHGLVVGITVTAISAAEGHTFTISVWQT